LGWEIRLTIETPNRDVTAIQMLRGVAASMVVFVHIDSELTRVRLPPLGSGWLASGVDIFFVISGFIMWTSVERRGGMSARAFLRDRLIRIVPLYWTITALVLIVALLAPQLVNSAAVRPWHVLASFLFLPARHPLFHNFWPLLIPGWSLNYEMLFYGIFALSLVVSSTSSSMRFLVITAVFSVVLGFAELSKGSIDVMNFYGRSISLEFLAGIALAILCRSRRVRPSYGYLLIIGFGFFSLASGTLVGTNIGTTLMAATLIVGGAVFLPPLRANPLSRLGDASYSLYLTHGIALSALAWLWAKLGIRLDRPFFVIVALACAFTVAFATYYLFELPITAALKRHFAARAQASKEQGILISTGTA
jgi:exopolysaccharide production protein ExoZ